MNYELNLGLENEELWRKCKVEPLGKNRFRLITERGAAVRIFEMNLEELLARIPKGDRDRMIVTGVAPPEVLVATGMKISPKSLQPPFRKYGFYNPAARTMIELYPSAGQWLDPN